MVAHRNDVRSATDAEAQRTGEKGTAIIRNPDGTLTSQTTGASGKDRGDYMQSRGVTLPGTEIFNHGHADDTGSIAPGPGDNDGVDRAKNPTPVGVENKGRQGILEFKDGRYRFTILSGAANLGEPRTGYNNEVQSIGNAIDGYQKSRGDE
jgi:hypothetical protein